MSENKVSKAVFVDRQELESTWVSVQEYPGDKIIIEGIRTVIGSESLLTKRIMLSKEAIAAITPMSVDWLKSKE